MKRVEASEKWVVALSLPESGLNFCNFGPATVIIAVQPRCSREKREIHEVDSRENGLAVKVPIWP